MRDVLVYKERDHTRRDHTHQVRLKTLVKSSISLVSAMRMRQEERGGELVDVAMGLSYLQCLRSIRLDSIIDLAKRFCTIYT